ncbi:MAG: UvrD-helicase domain-containing protein [Coriobacteriales bacterium]|jgi:DNA helicase-2/ATP-dependent DNA helicase PcrA|nr:UvrD-helicase domain-containing protein [Coriobacteriales bacterium]
MPLDLDLLNTEQHEAVLATEGPLLLLAGAGTGKTRVLTYRIAHLVENLGVSPYQILAITFTNKAAAEMRERLARLLGGGLRGMWVATFHAMCARMLRMDADKLGGGYTRDFSITGDDDTRRLFKELYAHFNIDAKVFPINGVRARIGAAKNELVGPERFSQEAKGGYDALCARVYAAYQERLANANSMDFDDLLVNAFNLLEGCPSVLAAYQERFRYVSIDEYQDTNHAQYRIGKLIADAHKNIMVVGDDDQSIYSWRGADIRNILEFEKDYPEATVLKLERNYRSTSNILDAANAVIAHNTERKSKRIYTEGAAGEKLRVYQAADERDEGRWVAAEIERLRRSGRQYADCAVFYRTNAQSRTLEDMLLRAGVPYRIVGGTRFFDRAEIRDVMAYLKCAVNPRDDISARRVLNTPRRGIGKVTLAKIEALAESEGVSFLEAVELSSAETSIGPGVRDALAAYAQLFKDVRCFEGSLRSVVEMIVARSGLEAALEAERTDEARARLENIHEFLGVAEEFDLLHRDAAQELGPSSPDMLFADDGSMGDPPGTPARLAQLGRFLEWLALRTDLDTLIEGETFVTLMTVHAAKGLEFPVVFIAGLEETIFPHAASAGGATGIEEERRLAYVAITRARELLYLTHAQTRSLYGSTQANQRSRFVREMPEGLLKLSGIGSDGFSGTGWEKRGDRRGIFGSGTSQAEGRVYGTRNPKDARKAERPVESFAAGDEVDHKVFGRGKVISSEGDTVQVKFDRLNDSKKLVVGYAPLVKIAQ